VAGAANKKTRSAEKKKRANGKAAEIEWQKE